MKLKCYGVAAVLGLSFWLSNLSVAQDTEPGSTTNDETLTPDAAVFDYQLQPPIGLKGRYTIYTRAKISQNLPALPATAQRSKTYAQRVETQSHQTFIIDYETISRDLRGGTVSRLIYRTIKQSSTTKINGKTAPLPDAAQTKKLEKLFDGILIDIKQAPDGRVLNIQGLDALRRRLDRVSSTSDASSKAMMKSLYDSIFNEKNLRQTWDSAALYPTKPVRVGDGWDYQLPLEMAGMKMDLHGTRRLIDLDATHATITDRANLNLLNLSIPNLPFNAKPKGSSNAPQISMSGSGTVKSKIIVNRATGMETETFADQRSTMTTKIKSPDKGKATTTEIPQWLLMQTHKVFRAKLAVSRF